MAQFHEGISSMIGTNTNDGGSKSKEVEHLLLRWLGEDSIFSKPSDAFREAAAEALKASAFQKDKGLAAHDVSELAFKLTPLLAQMRSQRPCPVRCRFRQIAHYCLVLSLCLALFSIQRAQVGAEARLEVHWSSNGT